MVLGAGSADAARSEVQSNEAVAVQLVTAQNGIAPDQATLSAGLKVTLEDGWKTYWRSPGEVGIAPEIDWAGSENVEDVTFLWPAPKRFRAFGIENFGYEKEVLFPLNIALSDPGAPAELRAKAMLLVCSAVCVPVEFDLQLSVPASSGVDQASAAEIAEWAAKVPQDGRAAGLTIGSADVDADMTEFVVQLRRDQPFEAPDIFPEMGSLITFGAPDIRLGEGGRLLWARLPVLQSDDPPAAVDITITDGAFAATRSAPLNRAPVPPPFEIGRAIPDIVQLAGLVLLAFAGGLILNVMPCVLPVLSIKLGSALKRQGQSTGEVRAGFLVTALGVLSFMWALAAVLIVARGLGASVGWGLQFQNPLFLSAMIALLFLFSANLFGVFEIALPEVLNRRLANAAGHKGHWGDFATGAFAAVLATPCSAPFLGTAVAFALAGRPIDIVLIFTALGAGLAVPYLGVAVRPALVHALPKPGRWMIVLKTIMGLLLVVTAAWLIWVLAGVANPRVAWLVTAALSLSVLLIWARHWLPRRAYVRSAAPVAALALGITLPLYLDQGRDPSANAPQDSTLAWVPFERSEISKRVSSGQVVFVDVTADWCLTCKANKALVLERDTVAEAFAAGDVVLMQADWTRPDEGISRYLQSYGRFGIPFNIVYGPNAPEGIILSEILSVQGVLDALKTAAAEPLAQRQTN